MLTINDKYCLHDCNIDKVYVQNSKLIFSFNDGVYLTNTECKKTQSCQMQIYIDELDLSTVDMHLSIVCFRNGRYRDITFSNLQKMLSREKLAVYLDFYSDFCDGMLLKCNFSSSEIEIQITEIKKIDIVKLDIERN